MIFDVQVLERGGWQVAAVVGDVDLATLPRLWPRVELLDGDRVAVDLMSVDWFDPVCLGVLLAAGVRARRRRARLVVVAVGAVGALLAEAGVDQVLEVVESLPDDAGPA